MPEAHTVSFVGEEQENARKRVEEGVGGLGGGDCTFAYAVICVLMSKKSKKKKRATMLLDTCSKASWQLSAMVIHAGSGSGDPRCVTQQL